MTDTHGASRKKAFSRPTCFETDEEFLKDYNEFLSSSEQPSTAIHYESQQDQTEQSHVYHGEHPTPTLLPQIKERKVPPRRRRRPVQTAPFPFIPHVQSHNSTFSRRQTETKVQTEVSGGTPSQAPSIKKVTESNISSANDAVSKNAVTPSDAARSAIASMSEEEILMAQRELLGQLKPDSVAFLNERWKSRDLGHFSNDVVHSEPKTGSKDSYGTRITSNNSSVSDQSSHGPINVNIDKTGGTTRGSAIVSSNGLSESDYSNIRESLLINPSVSSTQESEKMLWMTDAKDPLPSDTELDELSKKAIDAMGPIGRKRFDLDGHILTPEQIQTLPTHLGLHHHGVSPADAGYTLSDILTLLRSTAVPQRTAALRVFAALLSRHGRTVADALVESEALSLSFAPLPSPSSFYSSLTNQWAYVDAISALIQQYFPLFPAADCLIPDLFFASRFYSPHGPLNKHPVFKALACTGCATTLTRISHANVSVPGRSPIVTLALRLVRVVVLESTEACRKLAGDRTTIGLLHEMCIGSKDGEIRLVACDIIGHIVIGIGWERDLYADLLKNSILNEGFLREICNPLALVLKDDIHVLAKEQILCASGAVRVFRAALTFQIGPSLFSGLTQAVCRIIYENDMVATEVYLALEAYVHCLHESVISRTDEQKSVKRGALKGSGNQAKGKSCLSDLFVMDQISGLVPVALAAIRCFTSEKEGRNENVRAAAGHFAATLFAVYRIPFDQSSIALVLNTCVAASDKLSNFYSRSDHSCMQAIASMSHAGARLLARVQMEPAYVIGEVNLALQAVKRERDWFREGGGSVPWCPVANACAEWIGLLSNTKCTVVSIKHATELLSFLQDAQVIIDLISRCILRVEALCVLDGKMSLDGARKCASDLLPITFEGLCVTFHTERSNEVHGSKSPPLSILSVLRIWSKHADSELSFFRVVSAFVNADVIDAVGTLEVVVCMPQNYRQQNEERFKLLLLLATQIVSHEGKLFADKSFTVVSNESTIPNPAIANAIIDLAEYLVERGPVHADGTGDSSSGDPLASFLLALILRNDADLSLRISLWRQTVDNCGGAMLYAGATMILPAHQEIDVDEEVPLLRSIINSISHCILDGNRCPSIASDAIVDKLDYIFSKDTDTEIVHMVLRSIQEGGSSSLYRSLKAILENAVKRGKSFKSKPITDLLLQR